MTSDQKHVSKPAQKTGGQPRATGKVAVITGASRGIGYQIALQLAKSGVHIVAVARTSGGLEELDDAIGAIGGSATLAPLDITDYEGLDRLGRAIYERWGKLDILAANAGILGPLSPLGHVDPEAFEKTLNINLTANWRLVRALDPLLRKAEAARVVMMTSTATRKCKAYWGPYSISKAALEALARTYANELANTSAKVNLVNPGATRTAMRAEAMPGEDPATLPDAASIAQAMLPLLQTKWENTGQLFDISGGQLQAVSPSL